MMTTSKYYMLAWQQAVQDVEQCYAAAAFKLPDRFLVHRSSGASESRVKGQRSAAAAGEDVQALADKHM